MFIIDDIEAQRQKDHSRTVAVSKTLFILFSGALAGICATRPGDVDDVGVLIVKQQECH
jgi:hypothetical protein